MPGVDRDAMLALMQENVDQSAIPFSINATPTITGTTMNLFFENPQGSAKDLIIQIVDDTSGETVYESKYIQAGSYAENVTVTKTYAAGTYAATANITAYDPETHNPIGETAAGLVLTVTGSE